MTRTLLFALSLLASGCAIMPAVQPGYTLRLETRQECVSHCQALGMRLSAVVLVRNAAGCVCSEPGAVPVGDGGGAAANSGAYLVALEEEQRRQQEQQWQRQRDATHRNQWNWSSPGHGMPGSPGWHR